VNAEPEHSDRAEGQQPEHRARQHAEALAPAGGGEHEKRQQQPGGQLHADAGGEAHRRGAVAGRRTGRQEQSEREREQDQGVVVRARHRHHEQHRVQADKRSGPSPRVAQAAGGPCDERDRREARQRRERFEDPQAGGEAERRRGIADEREERTIGGVLEGPSEVREDLVGRGFGGKVRVGVEAVQRAHPRERHVAEDVLGEQRRPERQDQAGSDDRSHEGAHRQGARAEEHEQVGGAHRQHERLEAFAGKAEVQPRQRARHPSGPAAAARRDVAARRPGRSGCQQERRYEHTEQADAAEHAARRQRAAGARAPAPAGRGALGDRDARQRCRGSHEPIVTSLGGQASIGPASL
jgi:hypothetical protein